MRILLDENMDRRLQRLFDARYEVRTVSECGWNGKKNGELLRLASHEFDVFITMDRNIRYQQNLAVFNLGIILIEANSSRRQEIEPAIPKINRILDKLHPGELRIVKA